MQFSRQWIWPIKRHHGSRICCHVIGKGASFKTQFDNFRCIREGGKESGDSRYRYLHACCLIPTFRIHYLGFFALTPPCASLDSTIHVARFHIWQQTFPKSRKQPSSTEQAREMSKRRCSGIRGLGSRHGAGDAEVGKLID